MQIRPAPVAVEPGLVQLLMLGVASRWLCPLPGLLPEAAKRGGLSLLEMAVASKHWRS